MARRVADRRGKTTGSERVSLRCPAGPEIRQEDAVPKTSKTSRGGSKRGKAKPGKNRKGQRHTMTRMSVRKDQKRD